MKCLMGHCYCYYYYGVSWQNVSSTSSSVASWQGVKLAEFHFFAAALDELLFPAAAAVPPLFLEKGRRGGGSRLPLLALPQTHEQETPPPDFYSVPHIHDIYHACSI